METFEARAAVYKLSRFHGDVRAEGFAPKVFAPLPEAVPRRPKTRNWRVRRLARSWVPLEVVGRVRRWNDYPGLIDLPVFSERAVDALRDLLEPNGELLPLVSSLGAYFCYNLTTVADVLDRRRTKVEAGMRGTGAIVERYEFRAQRVKDLSIFRIPDRPLHLYVMQPFVTRALRAGLRGMHFCRVWPLPPGADWRELAWREAKRHARAGLAKGQTQNGHTLVLKLAAPAMRRAAERAALGRVLDELDAMLIDPDSTAQPVGNLEGTQRLPDAFHVMISCPDVDKLARKMRPWLKALRWPGGHTAVKRYGGIWDGPAREVPIARA